jgi:3-oxoacyl-[acyl-carrier-protein] synthase II
VSRPPAAITGVGAVTPLGAGAETLFQRWAEGTSGLVDGLGACTDFDPGEMLTRKEARRTERFVQLGLAACDEAVTAAWPDGCPYAPDRVACVLGVSLGGTQVLFDQYQELQRNGPAAVWPLTVPVTMPNAPPAVFAMRHGFTGETSSIASACSSSAQAIGEGLRMLRLDEADAVIVGGTEACLSEYVLAAFRTAGALSRSGICRPFDRERDGFVMGEGAGIIVLEQAEPAERRGADVLGHVAGYAATTDGYHLAQPEASGKVCAQAIRGALDDAGLEPSDVSYVNAHGTSTQANDRAETNALRIALGERAYEIPVSSTKSVVGHSIGAAGGVEAIATLLALRHRLAPPTVGLEHPDEDLDLDYVPGTAAPISPANGNGVLAALSNSFAFGGHNAVLAITTECS